MSDHTDTRRRDERPDEGRRSTRRRVAELWRAAGLGFTLVWTVLLVLVVAFWVRVTFYPRPGDDLPGSLQVLLAPVAIVAAGLVVWSLVCGWRLVMRRASGWDAIVVLGAFAIAVGVLVWVPGRFLDSLDSAPGSTVVALVTLGGVSVCTGLLAQRAFRRAAVGLEPGDDDYLDVAGDDPEAYADEPGPQYAVDDYPTEGYPAGPAPGYPDAGAAGYPDDTGTDGWTGREDPEWTADPRYDAGPGYDVDPRYDAGPGYGRDDRYGPDHRYGPDDERHRRG